MTKTNTKTMTMATSQIDDKTKHRYAQATKHKQLSKNTMGTTKTLIYIYILYNTYTNTARQAHRQCMDKDTDAHIQ